MDTDTKTKTKSGDDARQRLLETAEGLFAEKGFDGVGVRDITSAAGCNVAAINYHFGGKDKLYVEIMKGRMVALREIRLGSIAEVMSKEGTTLEDLLRAFSWAFIDPLVDESRGGQIMKLMMREMLDPHLPAEMFCDEVIKPVMGAIVEALVKVCPGVEMNHIVLCVHSLIAQLMHTIHVSGMMANMEGDECQCPSFEAFVDHIVKFTAIGIRGIADRDS
jgi:AcrR family transcriptional regulator